MDARVLGHEVKVLGPWELRAGQDIVAVPGLRLRVLLTLLVLSANQTVSGDTLVEQLWPEQPPRRPHRSLHSNVVRLRRLLDPGMIRTQPGIGDQLRISPDAVDLYRVRDLLLRAATAGSPQEELPLLRTALRLPFTDLYSTWLDRAVAQRLTEEWFAATWRRIELGLAGGPPEPLIGELLDLCDRYPTREMLWRQLITALHRARPHPRRRPVIVSIGGPPGVGKTTLAVH